MTYNSQPDQTNRLEAQPVVKAPAESLAPLDGIPTSETIVSPNPASAKPMPIPVVNRNQSNINHHQISKTFWVFLGLIIIGSGLTYVLLFTSIGSMAGINNSTTQTEESVTTENAAIETTSLDLTTIVGRDSQRKTDLMSLNDALEKYYLANNSYPISDEVEHITSTSATGIALSPTYISTIPIDPNGEYWYGYKSDGITYMLSGRLEDTTDPLATLENGMAIYRISK
ncbi:MAG: hypothetical protein CEN91_166 [Candidatus Berkelbacteria bacterium Licking1014_85]|uniref:Type II secretion system protein GspG C-terminal domain-containing protein n=1 Tax=Candidatus Berkelbacteria bacterium Licking1014_85 TaxID=2017148 RepID=A0A554LLA9_9BACT|nr:MAG: hypothetical protein CEN91_166 [Candidatus Berkelbacteria bacterium Licking1014_85]